jgi:AcrR family transcriptional regulator
MPRLHSRIRRGAGCPARLVSQRRSQKGESDGDSGGESANRPTSSTPLTLDMCLGRDPVSTQPSEPAVLNIWTTRAIDRPKSMFVSDLPAHRPDGYLGHVSSDGSTDVADLAAQRRKRSRAEASAKLLDAAMELLRESSFEVITVGAVAERAGVSAATADALFSSKNDLIVEICLRRIHGVALSTDATHGSIARVAAQLSQMMLVVAEEPAVATACAAVFLDSGPTADRTHELIGLEIHRLIATAVGPGSWPEVITTLELVFSGALIQAAAGAMTFQRAADRVQTAVSLILEGVPQY